MRKRFIYIFTVVIFTGCSLLGKPRHGELTRRFDSKTTSNGQIQDYIAIEGYAFSPDKPPPPPSQKPKTFHDLTPAVQQDLLKVFAQKDATSAAVINSLQLPLSQSVNEDLRPFIDDRTTFKKRIVLSVRNKSYNPADRIWKLFVTITKPSGIIRFSNSSALATDFETIDVGNLKFDRKTNFSSELTGGVGVSTASNEKSSANTNDKTEGKNEKEGTAVSSSTTNTNESGNTTTAENKIGGKISFGSEFSSKEEVALKQRFVKLSGAVNADRLSLYQESTSGIDLSGNIVADVEFSYATTSGAAGIINQTVFEFSNLKTGITYNPPAGIALKTFVVIYPQVAADIYGSISFEGVFRQVLSKDNTIAESDDKVNFVGGTYTYAPTNNILLLTREEVTPKFWRILNSAGNAIRIQTPALAAPIDLLFRSFQDATNFLEWVKANRAALVVNNIVSGNVSISPGAGVAAFTAGEINNLSIQRL